MKIKWCLLLLVTMFGASSLAEEELYQIDRRFFQPVDPPETPHIAWAKPYAAGTTKLLVIGPRGGQRETVELMQRMDLDVNVVYTMSRGVLGRERGSRKPWERTDGMFQDQVEDDIRQKLKSNYDVIVLGAMAWTALPADCRYEILKKLKEGTGLVLISVGDGGDPFLQELMKRECNEGTDFVTAGLPIPWLTTFAEFPTVKDMRSGMLKFYKLGDGRAVKIGWNAPLISVQRKDDTPLEEYDYTLSLPMRAILWAAKKAPRLLINPHSASVFEVNRSWADTAVRIPVRNDGPPEKLDVEIVKRNLIGGRPVAIRREGCEIPSGESAIDVPFGGDMPRGKTYVDVICRRDGKAVSWGSAAVNVASRAGIAGIKLNEYSLSCKDTVKGSLQLEGITRDHKLLLEIEDGYGRIISRKEIAVKPETSEISFEMPKCEPIAIMHHVIATLKDGDRCISIAKDWFSIRDLPFDNEDYHVYAWSGQPDSSFTGGLFAQQNYKAGFDLQYTRLSRYYLWSGIRNFPYIASLREARERPKDVPQGIRAPCINDPQWRKELVEGMKARIPEHTRFSTIHFSLGDENYLSGADVCFCERCNVRFKGFAQTLYPSIDALNQAHKTGYKSWGEVRPMTLAQAREHGSMAPWMDHRLHMEHEWFELYNLCINTIRSLCPDAVVGDEGNIGPTHVYSAFDLSKLCQLTQFRCPYYFRVPRDIFRSFKTRDDFTGYISGGYVGVRHERAARFFPWISVLDGHNQLMFYVEGGQEGGFAPDGSMYPFTRVWAEQIHEIKSGIGKMLIAAKPRHDGVAILYSRTSMIAGEFSRDLENVVDAMDGFGQLLRDCRIGYEYVSYDDLAAGKVTAARYKLLILPYTQSLRDKEVTAILKFAKSGGTVLADFEPGTMDEHGVRREVWPFRDLFGVELSGAGEPARDVDAAVKMGRHEFALVRTNVSRRIRLAGGRAMGAVDGCPVVIRKPYGTGRGIYLNCSVAPYIALIRERRPEQDEYLSAFRRLVQTINLVPAARIEPAVRGVELMRFVHGNAEYIAVVWSIDEMYRGDIKYNWKWIDEPEPRSVTLQFNRMAHIYEARSGRYCGYDHSVPITVKYGVPQIFVLLPHAIETFRISLPNEAVRAGKAVGFSIEPKTSDGPGCPHLYHVELIDPAGRSVPHYSRNVASPYVTGRDMGCAWCRIPIAYNDEHGIWKLRVTNVATKVTRSVPFQVID